MSPERFVKGESERTPALLWFRQLASFFLGLRFVYQRVPSQSPVQFVPPIPGGKKHRP